MFLIKNLVKDYGDFRVSVDSLELKANEITALWGRSGCGKSSLFRLLLGLDNFDRCSEITLNGVALNANAGNGSTGQPKIGFVFQKCRLFPHLSVLENICFPHKGDSSTQLDEFINKLGMDSLRDKKSRYLSGGEQQRVSLIRALWTQPDLLLLDEPFTALDSGHRRAMREILIEQCSVLNIPVLLITHDLENISKMAHRVVRMEAGEIMSSQTPQEFLKQFQTID